MSDALERADQALAARAWSEARAALEEADAAGSLAPERLEALALTNAMLGNVDGHTDAMTRAYRGYLPDSPARAARCAFFAGMNLVLSGDMAQGGGWLGRAGEAAATVDGGCPEQGLLMIPRGLMALEGGDAAGALDAFRSAHEMGRASGDPDLVALAGIGVGQALLDLKRPAEGMRTLDEVMLTITDEPVSPFVRGIVYCQVILSCRDSFDIRRAREWTAALDEWSRSQPDLVPFRGQCLVHRSEILQLGGDWDQARVEADRARDRLADPAGQPAIGMAYYQLGELHRMTGAFDEAREAYREANRVGHSPQPGMALLLLARGDARAAAAAIDTALEDQHAVGARCRLHAAAVEIALAAGDHEAARRHADQLEQSREEVDAPLLAAMCGVARGGVQLALGEAREALRTLRTALTIWNELDAPFDAARTRALIAAACRALGDDETAEMERDAARAVFTELGAIPELRALDDTPSADTDGLTPREVEVLRLVATGMTNKAIAEELVISQKTVARHLSNIFTKLDLATRAEATAYAFKKGLA